MDNRAAIYARISSDRESTEVGVDNQQAACRALAEQYGLEVVATYIDNDRGASTRSKKTRPDYADMLAAARRGEFGTVLAYSNSRLTRRPREFEDLIELNETQGVRFRTVVSGDDDLSTADGRMTARIKASVDAAEAERTGERVAFAKAANVAKGLPAGLSRTFGFEADNVTPHPVEAPALAWACDQVLSGRALHGIAAEWNAQGLTTARGAAWRGSSVHGVLKRERNAGILMHHGVEQPNSQITPLVDRDTWEAVCAILTDQSRRPKHGPNPSERWLSGVLTCVCGHPMIIGTGRSTSGAVPAYVCGTIRRAGKRVGSHTQVMASVAEPIARYLMFNALVQEGTQQQDGAEVVQARQALTELEQQHARVRVLFTKGLVDEASTERDLTALNQQLSNAREALDKAIADRAGADVSAFAERWQATRTNWRDHEDKGAILEQFYDVWDSFTAAQRRDMAKATLDMKVAQGGRGARRVRSRIRKSGAEFVGFQVVR